MLRVAELQDTRRYDGCDSAQPSNDLSRLVETSHVGVARGEKAVCRREARIFLDRELELRYCLVEASAKQMSSANRRERRTYRRARAEALSRLDMLYRGIKLPRPTPDRPADVPATRKARIKRQRASIKAIIAPISSPK